MKRNDFDAGFLSHTGHRPWPPPERPWIMTQTWHDLLFAHWPVDPEPLRGRVPPVFPLDLYDSQAWIGVIPFRMTNVAPRGVPAVPWLSAFPELNVRTYVHVEDKPGIFFFSLDASNAVAVNVARALFSLPYFSAAMRVSHDGEWVSYSSRRVNADPPAEFVGRYRPSGPAQPPLAGSLEHFLTERYCLYTTDRRRRPYRLEIHHAPWPLQSAELQVSVNTMAAAAGLPVAGAAPVLHFARRQDVVAWPLDRLG